jgi:hypothetical protein
MKRYRWPRGGALAASATRVKSWPQPAHTEITAIEIVCVTAPTITLGDIGYSVGTTSGGGELVAAETDEILDNGTTVVKGNITKTTLVHQIQDNATAPDSVLATNENSRNIYLSLTCSTALSEGGEFTWIIHHRFVPHSSATFGLLRARTSQFAGLINCYSFALKPEEHQPSGTCNFSRIDNAKLIFTGGTGPTVANIYAVNYNVLRIMSGMGGLAYSN